MWHREDRRYDSGNKNTTENSRYNSSKGYEDPNVNTRDNTRTLYAQGRNAHGPYEPQAIARDTNQRTMFHNTKSMSSPASSMMSPRGQNSSQSSSSPFPSFPPPQNMGPPTLPQHNNGPPKINQQHRGTLHFEQQNMAQPILPQRNFATPNMDQKNMGPPNIPQHNIGPPNMPQQNMVPPNMFPTVFMNQPPISLPPPGFNNMGIAPLGFQNNTNLPPDFLKNQGQGWPSPNSRLMGGSIPLPCNIPPPMDNSQCNNLMPMPPIPPGGMGNQGLLPMQLFSVNQMNIVNQQTMFHGEESSGNEHSKTRTLDQQWVNKFIEERQLNTEVKEETGPKVGEAKEILQKWFKILSKVEAQRDKLTECIQSGDSEWQRELQKTNFLKEELEQVQLEFSSQYDMDSVLKKVEKQKKKREYQKRRRKNLALEKIETEKKRFELHLQIDQWREKEIAKDKAKFKAASMKKEAGGVLGEVRTKQGDSGRAISLLQALKKLRSFRKQEAEVKGVYQKPTSEESKDFERRTGFLEKLMNKYHELYDSEEKALVVMLAEEEEEKEKERREKKHTKQLAEAAASDSSDPMREFYRYYTQAENGLDSLLHIRHGWDMYIVPETLLGASCIPQGHVSPSMPTSKTWAQHVKDDG